MKKERKNSIRNLCLAMVAVILIFAFTETVLSLQSREGKEYASVAEENNNVMILQSEHMALDKLFMSGTNVYNMKYYDTLVAEPEFKEGYPVINYLTDRTEIEDAVNIVVIGDSFVFGAYSLNRNEIFWRVLENDFRKDGKRVNVFGVGATGANAYEELAWLKDSSLIEDLDPDLVIFGYVYNDADDSIDIEGTEVDWEKELPFLKVTGKLMPNVTSKLLERISARTMYTDKYQNSEYIGIDGAPPVLKGRFYEKYKTDFVQKLDEFAATVSFPVAVVTLPNIPDSFMLEALYEPLAELYSEAENISYYNCIEDFNKFASLKHRKNYSVNVADFHPGSAANRFYADYIKEFIEKDFAGIFENTTGSFEKSDSIIVNEYLPRDVAPEKISEDEKEAVYKIKYPSEEEVYNVYGIEADSCFLKNPLGKEHIRISFSDAVSIEQIAVTGLYTEAEVYCACLNEKLNYDDHSVYECGTAADGVFLVEKNKKVTSVLICAAFEKAENRELTITFKKGVKAQ